MRLLATVAGPYGNCRPCIECGYQPAIGERIYGDCDTANIYCERWRAYRRSWEHIMRFRCIDCGRIWGHGDGPEPTICVECRRKRVAREVSGHNDGNECE